MSGDPLDDLAMSIPQLTCPRVVHGGGAGKFVLTGKFGRLELPNAVMTQALTLKKLFEAAPVDEAVAERVRAAGSVLLPQYPTIVKLAASDFKVEGVEPIVPGLLPGLAATLWPSQGSVRAVLDCLTIYGPGASVPPTVAPVDGPSLGWLVVCLPAVFVGGVHIVREAGARSVFRWGRNNMRSDAEYGLVWRGDRDAVMNRLPCMTVSTGPSYTLTFDRTCSLEVLPMHCGFCFTLTYRIVAQGVPRALPPIVPPELRNLTLSMCGFVRQFNATLSGPHTRGARWGFPSFHMDVDDSSLPAGALSRDDCVKLQNSDAVIAMTALAHGCSVHLVRVVTVIAKEQRLPVAHFPSASDHLQLCTGWSGEYPLPLDEAKLRSVLGPCPDGASLDHVTWILPQPTVLPPYEKRQYPLDAFPAECGETLMAPLLKRVKFGSSKVADNVLYAHWALVVQTPAARSARVDAGTPGSLLFGCVVRRATRDPLVLRVCLVLIRVSFTDAVITDMMPQLLRVRPTLTGREGELRSFVQTQLEHHSVARRLCLAATPAQLRALLEKAGAAAARVDASHADLRDLCLRTCTPTHDDLTAVGVASVSPLPFAAEITLPVEDTHPLPAESKGVVDYWMNSFLSGAVGMAGRGSAPTKAAAVAAAKAAAPAAQVERQFTGVPADKAASFTELRVGALVEIQGLVSAVELNGQHGKCVDFDEDRGRWQIALVATPGKSVNAKPVNLHVLPAASLVSCVLMRCGPAPLGTLREFLYSPQDVLFTEASPSPVMRKVGLPLAVRRLMTEDQDAIPRTSTLDNQPATWFMVLTHDGFAPPKWQYNIGDVMLCRMDKKPLRRTHVLAIYDYFDHLMDLYSCGAVRDHHLQQRYFLQLAAPRLQDYSRKADSFEF